MLGSRIGLFVNLCHFSPKELHTCVLWVLIDSLTMATVREAGMLESRLSIEDFIKMQRLFQVRSVSFKGEEETVF